MLKKTLLMFSITMISVHSFAYDARSCQIKKEKLIEQLHYAKKYNNTHRIEGLNRALARLNQQCAQYVKK